MVTKEILEGKHVFLRQIELSDCSERYVEWLNDPEVNQYLETKWYDQNIASIREFVRYQRKNSHSVLFSIMTGKSVGGVRDAFILAI